MLKKVIVVILVCLLAFPVSVYFLSAESYLGQEELGKAEEYFTEGNFLNTPKTKEDGSKFTIAYVDIDPYPGTGEMLFYFIEQLKKTGWISYEEELPFDPADTDAKELINYLADKNLGDYIQFSRDANYYIAVDGEEYCKKSIQKHVQNKDIDLIFSLGTSPGVMLIKDLGIEDIPIMVCGSVDPVGAGLADNEEYSGKDNVWCHTNFDVYINQLQFYHSAFPFTNIGMVYYSETIAAMKAYRIAAEKENFKITEKQIDTLSNAEDKKEVESYYNNLEQSYQSLVKEGIDAFMLNTDMIKDESRVYSLLNIFYEHNIPVFVQNSEYYVEDGAFMVVTASDAQTQAPFIVDAFARILNGDKPGNINQKFVTPPYLSINLKIAEQLQYEVKEEMILSAEKLYNEIKSFTNRK